jgi:hypothetical protein
MNLNQPKMAYIAVYVWTVFHHPTELVLSVSVKGETREQGIAGGGVRRLPTCFQLPNMGKL